MREQGRKLRNGVVVLWNDSPPRYTIFMALIVHMSLFWCAVIVLFHSQSLHESQHNFQTLPNNERQIFCELLSDGTGLGQKCRCFQNAPINYSHVSSRTVIAILCMINIQSHRTITCLESSFLILTGKFKRDSV